MSAVRTGRVARRPSSLATRLLAAFVAVALAAVAIVTLVAAIAIQNRTSTLIAQQRAQLSDQISSLLSAAYANGSGTWSAGDLTALQAAADASGVRIAVTDPHGQQVTTITPGHHGDAGERDAGERDAGERDAGDSQDQGHHGSAASPSAGGALTTASVAPSPPEASSPAGGTLVVPIVAGGTQVGTAQLTLPAGFDNPLVAARDALWRSLLLGAALAILLAVAVAAFVTRRISRPLLALTDASRALTRGEQAASTLPTTGPGELGELARAFATMADTVRREDELRRTLVADVAHELRTPVTILRGQTEQILDGIAEPTPDRLVSLHDEVLRLQRLTDDLATLSAANAAGITVRRNPIELDELTERALSALAVRAADAEVSLRREHDGEVWVEGDEDRLVQVLHNLLTNAIRFTPPGGTVTTSTRRDGIQAVLTVTDTGPGIPPEDLPHVFDRFWQGAAAKGRGGSGIGLAVVETLVHAHGGTVTATNLPGGGAALEVHLPLAGPYAARRQT